MILYDDMRACDSDALERLEQLMLSQKPASIPWEPITDYSWEARKAIETPHAELIRDVFQPAKVLDYGCGTGALISCLRFIGVKAKGYEPSNRNRHLEPANTKGRISRERWGINWDAPYSLVICREVLEHLTIREIAEVVRDLCTLGNMVYITTRFAQNPDHLLDVDISDDLDPTHITMLNQDFLRVLFVLEGFKRRADLETRMDWMQKGRVLVYERAT